jgi:hypothetical protein
MNHSSDSPSVRSGGKKLNPKIASGRAAARPEEISANYLEGSCPRFLAFSRANVTAAIAHFISLEMRNLIETL